MVWQDAVQAAPEGVRLMLETSAGAQQSLFPAGYNAWRQRIGIRVHAPAQDGKANKEVCALVAAHFELAAHAVELVSGHTDTRKTLLLRDTSMATIVAKLEGLL